MKNVKLILVFLVILSCCMGRMVYAARDPNAAPPPEKSCTQVIAEIDRNYKDAKERLKAFQEKHDDFLVLPLFQWAIFSDLCQPDTNLGHQDESR